MFTGIIETTGRIVSTVPVAGGRRLRVDCGPVSDGTVLGASIAINGVCLTVCAIDGAQLEFDAITETLRRTNLGDLKTGDAVNLERALRADGRLDGHFVQGHVDASATLNRKIASAAEWVLWFKPEPAVLSYLIPKGSVAIDGISLTIAAVESDAFSVAIIPTTLALTTLERKQVGDRVNIETDIVARTVVHHLRHAQAGGGLTLDALGKAGFL